MFELTRSVRFSIPVGVADAAWRATPRHNTFAGWPSCEGLAAWYEIHVACRAEPDAVTGYLADIRVIDEAVRGGAIDTIARAFVATPPPAPGLVLREITRGLADRIPVDVSSVRWSLSPYHAITMETADVDRVIISQQFEFSASHRLHVESMSDEENRVVFGKCNNPHGHGHNYRLEVEVAVPLDTGGAVLGVTALEAIVDEHVIRRFDHRHLNRDTEEFRTLNPSVEQIARVCHGLLSGPVAGAGGDLVRVTVWETEKTRCTYPA